MHINQECRFVLGNLYLYDIPSCHCNILSSVGWDVSSFENLPKPERNRHIGMLRKQNPVLSAFLENSVEKIINSYILENGLKKDEIITRQKDGLIVTKKFRFTNLSIPIELRERITRMIISLDRRSYLCFTLGGKTIVKGIGRKPLDHSFYDLLGNIDYSNAKSLCEDLEIIRRRINSCKKTAWFSVPAPEGGYLVPLKNGFTLRLNKEALSRIDPDDIDKKFVWAKYIYPFAESILAEIIQ